MTPFETIRLAARYLDTDASVRFRCPWCRGGRNKENSFIVTRNLFTAKYICHRATCSSNDSTGYLCINGKPSTLPIVGVKSKPAEFTEKTYKPSTYVLKSLESRFQLPPEAIAYHGIKQTADNDIVIPIYSDTGTHQGNVVRLDKITNTKAKTYHKNGSDGMGWFRGKPEYNLDSTLVDSAHLYNEYGKHCVVLVEDMYSAIKANYFMDSVCLLGTSFNSEQAAKVSSMGYKRVLLALDYDASAKAVSTAIRLKVILPTLRVVLLHKDLKDIAFNELGTFLSEHSRRM